VRLPLLRGRGVRDLLTHVRPESPDGELEISLEPYAYRWLMEEPA
jgi:hypothetical protein